MIRLWRGLDRKRAAEAALEVALFAERENEGLAVQRAFASASLARRHKGERPASSVAAMKRPGAFTHGHVHEVAGATRALV